MHVKRTFVKTIIFLFWFTLALSAALAIYQEKVDPTRYTYNCNMNTLANIYNTGTPNIHELQGLCDSRDDCVGFDTLGNLKSSVEGPNRDSDASIYSKIPGKPLSPLPNLWPLPREYSFGQINITLSTPFSFITASPSKLLSRAFDRYAELIFPNIAINSNGLGTLKVIVSSANETLQLETPEDYVLSISDSEAILTATTVYGALRGLETFSQLVEFDYDAQTYNIFQTPVKIVDSPYFPHRGILIDTSRHWLPIKTLKSIIDSLSYAKLNVLHWHVVDSQSFPLECKSFPKLWEGAWTKKERYTLADVEQLVLYAKDRGVRVMPEFDGPGHMWSWGIGYPELLPDGYHKNNACQAICPSNPCMVPVDPTNPKIYQILEGLIQDITNKGQPNSGVFFDNMLHLGGDEVQFPCWMQSLQITNFMQLNKMTNYEQLYEYFVNKVHQIARNNNRIPVHWEEVFLHFGKNLSSDTIFHVWLHHETLAEVVAAGYRGILSNWNNWYLDYLGTRWTDVYTNDILQSVDVNNAHLVLGGEACMWGESVDPSDLFARIWPRSAAVAEALWNYDAPRKPNAIDLAVDRIQDFRCHIMERGIDSAPVNSQYPTQPGSCYFS